MLAVKYCVKSLDKEVAMSRIAKAPIAIPANVQVDIKEQVISVKGPKGHLSQEINKFVSLDVVDENSKKILKVKPKSEVNSQWAQAGTARANIYNMIHGVSEGYKKTLELVGVGYRAQASAKSITLSLGFSHPVEYILPEGITAETPNQTTIVLSSIDKQKLGQAAAKIRGFRPPEPYKGKGIKYAGENILRKEAKKK